MSNGPDLTDLVVQDFTRAVIMTLVAKQVHQVNLTEEGVIEALGIIRDKLQDPESDFRSVLGRRVPEGVETLYWTAVGSAHDRAVRLFQITMAMF